MLWATGTVLALTVLGDAISAGLGLPVPGAAIGMLVLAGVFAARGAVLPSTARLFDAISPHLPLFFVPAAVGVVANAELLTQAWLSVVAAIVFGTAVTLIVTGLLAQVLFQRVENGRES